MLIILQYRWENKMNEEIFSQMSQEILDEIREKSLEITGNILKNHNTSLKELTCDDIFCIEVFPLIILSLERYIKFLVSYFTMKNNFNCITDEQIKKIKEMIQTNYLEVIDRVCSSKALLDLSEDFVKISQ